MRFSKSDYFYVRRFKFKSEPWPDIQTLFDRFQASQIWLSTTKMKLQISDQGYGGKMGANIN